MSCLLDKKKEAKKNSVQRSTHLHSACQVEAPIGGSGHSDTQVCAFNADAYVPRPLHVLVFPDICFELHCTPLVNVEIKP